MNDPRVTDQDRALASEQTRSGVLSSERPIQTQVKEFFASDRGAYLAEWGVRVTDYALIFHFYPPKDAEEEPNTMGWDPGFEMPARLEKAIGQVFDTDRITCGFVQEQQSFYVIAGGYGRGLDPRLLAERFLDMIDVAFGTES